MTERKIIYLDYAATAPRNPDIVNKTATFSLSQYANIGRGLYTLSEEAQSLYRESKKTVAQWVGCDPVEVIYTYSTTYAINLVTLALEHNNILGKWDVILLSQSEHHANIVPWQILAERVGAVIKFVQLDAHFQIDMDHLKTLFDSHVKVVSLQYASNVTGALHPLEKVRDIIGRDVLFFVDAAQVVMHWPIDMRWIGADGVVFSGHKIMADTWIGVLALWKVLQKAWQSPLGGGGAINFVTEKWYEQAGLPEKWEPGTPHITGAISLKHAINVLTNICPVRRQKYRELVCYTNNRFRSLEQQNILQLFHSDTPHALGIWSFALSNIHCHDIAESLDAYHICVRSGHHCCEPLHLSWWIPGTVRVSIGFETTQEEIDTFFTSLQKIIVS